MNDDYRDYALDMCRSGINLARLNVREGEYRKAAWCVWCAINWIWSVYR